ncbi:MAG: histidine--tRNA ligase [Gammaproteobacteria bacterium]|nr:histidine--tRNA ligase [Planctomycetota bacterium]MBM4223905.1 histidine--tRNA ligase [Gammaproteobacteria bacterium]
MSRPIIKPTTLKGFRDYLPSAMIAREMLVDTARQVYRSYGFSPIDTPSLEHSEILLGKGGDESDKQLFRFLDNGGRDVALRFDLTVPLARFVAQHIHEVGTPFKRYHIGTVWRGENTQKGRYREFMQCDFDTIGTTSNASDIETLLVIHDLFERLGFSKFTIRVNNRLVLNGLLQKLGLADKSAGVLRCIDKLPKAGPEKVIAEMTERVGATAEQAANVIDLVELKGEPLAMLTTLESKLAGNEAGLLGVARLRELFTTISQAGVPVERVELDLAIARGLDYYTGTIYETFLGDLPGIGSVCSGGRYDNLAELFTTQKLPGVGASLGLDRLLAAMEELGMVGAASTPAQVLIAFFDANHLGDYQRVAHHLRSAGLPTEVYPEAVSLGDQLKYAARKGFPAAVIAGDREFAAGQWQVKNLRTREQVTVASADLIEHLRHTVG